MAIIIFILLQLLNVILSTIRSICTIKCGRLIAAISNAIYFGFYTIIMIYTVNDDLIKSIWMKALITSICNAIGVYFSKWLLELFEKEKLWEIVATLPKESDYKLLHIKLNENSIGNNYILLESGETVFHIYSNNKSQSRYIKGLLLPYNAKYIVHESGVQL